ncbi:alpha/beta fold hydrolase [Actinocorallia longicatena]|uniref:Alpha/beta fold hydrolase n=1 Tax=Actinocorallia longicatena TaxID=111803 RepID=A0ABP6QDJ7_9ACTN
MIELGVQTFPGRDGARLAYRELGEGRPLILIHGYFSTAKVNWVRYGHAEKIAAAGFRVIMPDLRGHGDSASPHERSAYPADVLADDGFALLDHLGIGETGYDLGGYSLGGRTTVRMLARGAAPRRAIVAGMGLSGITRTAGRSDHFRDILTRLGTFERGTPEWKAEAFLKTVGGDPAALLNVLETFTDTPEETLAFIDVPVLVVTGEEDRDNGSAGDLAETLPDARLTTIPGDHMSAVTRPELAAAIIDFLTAP